MNACPKCGGTSGYKWIEHRLEMHCTGLWGTTPITKMMPTRDHPQYCKCLGCNKRVLISAAIERGMK